MASQQTFSTAAPDVAAITATMHAYEAALNAADTNAVIPLYEADGVFMQPSGPPAVGLDAIRRLYDQDFAAIRLHVRFRFEEIVPMAPDWAFVRTSSAGTTTIVATGAEVPEANQELFILHKGAEGTWRIARYSFSSTNPPPQG